MIVLRAQAHFARNARATKDADCSGLSAAPCARRRPCHARRPTHLPLRPGRQVVQLLDFGMVGESRIRERQTRRIKDPHLAPSQRKNRERTAVELLRLIKWSLSQFRYPEAVGQLPTPIETCANRGSPERTNSSRSEAVRGRAENGLSGSGRTVQQAAV